MDKKGHLGCPRGGYPGASQHNPRGVLLRGPDAARSGAAVRLLAPRLWPVHRLPLRRLDPLGGLSSSAHRRPPDLPRPRPAGQKLHGLVLRLHTAPDQQRAGELLSFALTPGHGDDRRPVPGLTRALGTNGWATKGISPRCWGRSGMPGGSACGRGCDPTGSPNSCCGLTICGSARGPSSSRSTTSSRTSHRWSLRATAARRISWGTCCRG